MRVAIDQWARQSVAEWQERGWLGGVEPDMLMPIALISAFTRAPQMRAAQSIHGRRQFDADTDPLARAILAHLAAGPATWDMLSAATSSPPGKVRDRLGHLRTAGYVIVYRSRSGGLDRTWYELGEYDALL